MQFKEETELTWKMRTDSKMQSRMTAKGGWGSGVEGLNKKAKDSWTWIAVC